MPAPRVRLPRFVTETPHSTRPVLVSSSDFYREEVLRCQQCLDAQRDCYSEQTLHEVEEALTRVMARLDQLCGSPEAEEVVGRLLRHFDVAAGLMNWSDPTQIH